MIDDDFKRPATIATRSCMNIHDRSFYRNRPITELAARCVVNNALAVKDYRRGTDSIDVAVPLDSGRRIKGLKVIDPSKPNSVFQK